MPYGPIHVQNDKVEQNQFDILIQGGCFFIEDDW